MHNVGSDSSSLRAKDSAVNQERDGVQLVFARKAGDHNIAEGREYL